MKKYYSDSSSVPFHLLFIAMVGITILSAFIIAFFYHRFVHALPLDVSILIPKYRSGLMPKPQERFVFLMLAIMIPLATFAASLMVFRGIITNGNASLVKWLDSRFTSKQMLCITGIFVFITAMMLYFPFIGYDFSQALMTQARLPSEHPVFVLMMTLLVAAIWYAWQFKRADLFFIVKPSRNSVVIGWLILGIAMLLQTGAWRVLSELSISHKDRWDYHADAVIYSVGQVMAGKTLLVDLPAQYGLYAELMRPVFKLIGLSILHFTALCAALQVLGLISIYWVINRVVRDGAIRGAFAIALVMVTFETIMLLIDKADPYFQYWPIRFFWPAVAVLIFYRYSMQPTPWLAFLVSLISAIGTLWNIDSGLMIVLAFAGVLVAKWFVMWSSGNPICTIQRQRLYHALIAHIATFCIVVFLMLGYLYFKGGAPLHWDWLFGYQTLFYGLGFMMQPMPLYLYPWMPILGIYLMALIVAVRSWAFNPLAKNADLLLFLSLLGLGLFVYYEGRSHHLNLIKVCWPALMLIAILADRVLRGVRAGLLGRQHLLLPIAALSVLVFCSIPFVIASEKLGESAMTAFKNRKTPEDRLVNNELNFIRAHSKSGDECVILSLRQGLYYAATGIGSPISGPGYVEMLLQRDRDAFLDQLTHQRFKCIFVGTGESSGMDLGVDPITILQGYKIIARNAYRSMLYLRQG